MYVSPQGDKVLLILKTTDMKTTLPKRKFSRILILGLVFIIAGCFQTRAQSFIELLATTYCEPADPNINCTSNSADVVGAYIGLADGTKITDAYIPSGNHDAYVFINVEKNGNKYDLYAQFDLVIYNATTGTKTPTFVQAHAGGSIQTTDYRIYFPIPNYILNGEVNSLVGIENMVVGWDNTNDNTPTCLEGNYSSCNADIPDIIAQGPFIVIPSYEPINCNSETTSVEFLVSGGTSPYTINFNGSTINTSSSAVFDNIGAGSYVWTASDSDSNSDGGTLDITAPDAVSIAANITPLSCPDNKASIDITPSGGNGSYSYDWDVDGTGDFDDTQDLSNLDAGDYTVTVKDGNGCMVTETYTIESVICCSLTVNTGSDFSVCEGSILTLSCTPADGTAPFTYLWTKGGIEVATTQNPTVSLSAVLSDAGTYNIKVIDDNGCEATDDVVVTVNDLPTVQVNGPLVIDCNNTTAALDGTGSETTGVTYAWTTADGTFSGATNAITATATSAGTYTLTVTETATGCSDSKSIIVSADETLPNVDATNNSPVCNNSESVQLDEIGGESIAWQWSSNGNAVFSNVSTKSPTVTNFVDGEIFTVTITGENGCQSSDATQITFYPKPVCSISGNTTLCPEAQGVIYSAPGGMEEYSWDISGNAQIIGETVGQSVTVNAGQGCETSFTLYLTVTDAKGCTSSCEQTVAIIDNTPPVINVPTEDLTIECNDISGIETWAANATATDNCSDNVQVTFEYDTPDGNCEQTISVTFSATDICGNTGTATKTITIIDQTAPTFTDPDDITLYSDENCEYNAGIEITGDVTSERDNCSNALQATFSDVITQGQCPGELIINRTWSLMDECGNRAPSKLQIITIKDTIAPSIVCNDITVALNADRTYTLTEDDKTALFTVGADNCSSDEDLDINISQEVFECGDLGENQITITVTDGCGNASSCTAIITVEKGDADCGEDPLEANPDVLEMIVCPGDNIEGSINLLANDTGIGEEGITMSVASLPDNVNLDLVSGEMTYASSELTASTIEFNYTICHNVNTENCSETTVTINILLDSDCDDIPDVDDIDDDNDGILDVNEEANALNANLDSDNDGIVDRLDIDSDNDGITDNVEWQQTIAEGEGHDDDLGLDYYAPTGNDSDNDGWDDRYDDNGENIYYPAWDHDGDGIPDYLDQDADDDNIPDWIEGHDAAPHDTIADVEILDVDTDGDGLDDAYDIFDTTQGWVQGQNPIGSNAPLQDMAGDTINNIRDWRDDYFRQEGNDGEAEGCNDLNIPDGFSPNDDGFNDYFEVEFICAEGEQLFEEVYPDARIEIFNRWGNLVYEQERFGNTQHWGNYEAWWDGRSTNDLQVGKDKLPSATYFYILYLNSGNAEPITGSIFLND
jgi:gliding motility-associated-like protein